MAYDDPLEKNPYYDPVTGINSSPASLPATTPPKPNTSFLSNAGSGLLQQAEQENAQLKTPLQNQPALSPPQQSTPNLILNSPIYSAIFGSVPSSMIPPSQSDRTNLSLAAPPTPPMIQPPQPITSDKKLKSNIKNANRSVKDFLNKINGLK